MRLSKPDRDIVLVQSADAVNYFSLLRTTARINREFCLKQDVDYTCHHGIIRGFHPWQACFNRIYLLHNLIELGFTGWYIHLDADAWVRNVSFDIRTYLAECADHSMIFAKMASLRLWDVNDGIFLANCAHPDTQEIVVAWKQRAEEVSEDSLRAAPNWYDNHVPGDQSLLQDVLRRDDERLTAHIRYEPISFMNAPTSNVFCQLLRAQQEDPVKRLQHIQHRVALAIAQQKLPPEDPVAHYCNLARTLGVSLPREADGLAERVAHRKALVDYLRGTLKELEAPPLKG
jgi:hypothetical protein